MTLEVEWDHYLTLKPELIRDNQVGKHIVIKGTKVIGIKYSWEDALALAFEKVGVDEAVFVHKILVDEPVLHFTRDYFSHK